MATKTTKSTRQLKFDATRPLYAAVGAGDLAVAYARTAATDVQARVAKVDVEPKALRDQAVTLVSTRVEELQADAKKAQAAFEARLAELQTDAKALPSKVEKLVNDYLAELNKGYAELASRGEVFVTKVRKQEATQQTKAAAKSTASRAKATRTTAKKSAKQTTTSAKATATTAKKTVAAAQEATTDAAEKAGA